MNGRPTAARQQLERLLAPELVDAIEDLVAARVDEALAERDGADGSPWMSYPKAAEYLGVSERTLERWVERKRLRSHALGRRRLLHRDDLDRAAAGEETAPTAPPRRRAD